MKTILITGCSTGFGLEIARHFFDRGDWNVIATMRSPREDVLPASDRLRILPLDVTDAQSIRAVVEAAGPVDVLVNNAGIGFLNALEGTPIETVRDIFETNMIGTIAMAQAFVPQMRERGAGVIVNVTSSVTLKAFPLLAAYTASKTAVNGFSESLALEVEPFGIRVHVVMPGLAPDTAFADNARGRVEAGFPEPYLPIVEGVMAYMQEPGPITHASDVAEAVWRVATDPAAPLRLAAGADAEALMPV